METTHVKIFSGSSILVQGLAHRLTDAKISYLIKDRPESARLGGFGEQRNAVELWVINTEVEKAQPVVDSYQEEINS